MSKPNLTEVGEMAERVLNLAMPENDANAPTVRDYLGSLLMAVWTEGEGFSGKRPFGNSGWEYDLFQPLIAAKLVKGKLDADGYIESVDEKKARRLIDNAICAFMFVPPKR